VSAGNLESMSRGKLSCAIALVAVASVFAAAAVAAPPQNLKVTESGGRITATWREPGIFNIPLAAEIARSPKTAGDGSFSEPGKIRAPLGELDTTYTSPVLQNGIWYFHVGAYELGHKCDVDDEGNLTCPTDWSPTVTVRIGPGDGPSVSDTVTGFQKLVVAKRQKLAKLRVQASMPEKGTITVRGTVSVPNAAKVFKLKPVSVAAAAGKTVTIRVKLPKKALKAAKRTLAKGRKVSAKLTILAKDAAGNKQAEKRSVRLR
jgi:hypothetical protein